LVDALLDWLAGLPTLATYGVLMLLSAVENVFPPVPADVAVALGAFLAQRGEVSAPLLGVLCWLANTLTAAGTYALGRVHGEKFFSTGWGRKLLPPDVMAALRDAYARHGVAAVFISRLLPGVRAAVTPFAGVAGMSPLRALLPAALASGLWYTFLIAVGSTLGLSWDKARRVVDGTTTVLTVVGLLAAVACGAWLWRRARARRAT
jgi:membrane protein DedA with SNARE-associated domain